MRPTLLMVLLLAGPASTLSAQGELPSEVLALGHDLRRVVMAPGGVYVQGAGRVSLMDLGTSPGLSAEAELVPDAFVWTSRSAGDQRFLEMQTSLGRASSRFHRPGEAAVITRATDPDSFFRGATSASPEFRDFLSVSGPNRYEVRPRLDGLDLAFGDDDAHLLLPALASSEQSLGYGLGYEMSARVVVPFFSFVPAGANGEQALLYRDGAHFRYRPLGSNPGASASVAWGRAPASESTEVLRFDQRVPPLVADYDEDGASDLVHLDPGGGYVFVYRGNDRAEGKDREPDQIFNVGGHALWRYLADVDGDGKLDLLIVTMSRMNIIAQVNVMRERSLPVRLSCRRQRADGKFEASTTWTVNLQLPCEIAITRNLRRVRFRSPLLVLGQADGKARLLATRNGVPTLLEKDGDDWKELASAPGLLLETGHWAAPFDAPVADFDGDGHAEVILLARDLDGELDRLIRLRLP